MGEGDSPPPTAPIPLNRFSWNEIYNYFPETTLHAKCQGAMSMWSVWANSQFGAPKSVLFCFFTGATGRVSEHTSTRNTSLYVVLAKVVLFGVQKDEIWNFTPLLWKKRKKLGRSWRSTESCSRPNSGMVSHIHLKLGIVIEHPNGIMWHDFKVEISKVKVTTSRNVFT